MTNLGNLAVVGPVAVLVWVWLLRRRGLRAALRYQWPDRRRRSWSRVGLKLVARATGGGLQGTPLELSTGAPSGHMAMSAVVYGGLMLMLLRRGPEPLSLLTTLLVVAGAGRDRRDPGGVARAYAGGCDGRGWWSAGVARSGSVWRRRCRRAKACRDVTELVLLVTGAVALIRLTGVHFESGSVM